MLSNYKPGNVYRCWNDCWLVLSTKSDTESIIFWYRRDSQTNFIPRITRINPTLYFDKDLNMKLLYSV